MMCYSPYEKGLSENAAYRVAKLPPDRWGDSGHLDRIDREVRAELARATSKHGYHNNPISGQKTRHESFIICAEEVGEVARALTYDGANRDKLEEELVQTIAMFTAMLIGVRKGAK